MHFFFSNTNNFILFYFFRLNNKKKKSFKTQKNTHTHTMAAARPKQRRVLLPPYHSLRFWLNRSAFNACTFRGATKEKSFQLLTQAKAKTPDEIQNVILLDLTPVVDLFLEMYDCLVRMRKAQIAIDHLQNYCCYKLFEFSQSQSTSTTLLHTSHMKMLFLAKIIAHFAELEQYEHTYLFASTYKRSLAKMDKYKNMLIANDFEEHLLRQEAFNPTTPFLDALLIMCDLGIPEDIVKHFVQLQVLNILYFEENKLFPKSRKFSKCHEEEEEEEKAERVEVEEEKNEQVVLTDAEQRADRFVTMLTALETKLKNSPNSSPVFLNRLSQCLAFYEDTVVELLPEPIPAPPPPPRLVRQ